MSELRTALLLVGVLVLGAILLWSMRTRIAESLRGIFDRLPSFLPARRTGHAKRRRRSARSAHLARHDALARDFASSRERVDQVLLGPDLTVVDESEETAVTGSPADPYPVSVPEPTEPILPAPAAEPEPLDIDYSATVPGDDILTRDQALGIYRQHEFELEKPHRIFGRCSLTDQWRDLEQEPGTGTYQDIALTIQLADRDGPVSSSDLTRFSTLVLQMADSLGRRFQFSGTVEEAIEQAADLDALCRDFDQLVVVNVLSPTDTPFTGPDIDRCARDFGLVPGKLNIYQRENPERRGAARLFAMANLYQPGYFDPATLDSLTTKGLTLFMRLAGISHPAEVFLDMAETARGIAGCLGGDLVDQNHRPIDDHSIEQIRGEIVTYTEALRSEGIVPGGKVAQRLF